MKDYQESNKSNQKRYAIKFVYRIDDIHPRMMWSRFNEIMDIFSDHGVVPLLGVIPDNKDQSLMFEKRNPRFFDIIKNMRDEGKIEISQHGYHHLYTTTQKSANQRFYGRVSPSEFVGLSYKEQYDMLKHGKEILRSHDIESDIWMAPSHTSDKNTFKALKALGFKYVTDGISLYPYKKSGLLFVPQQVWQPKKEFAFGVFTVCIHLDDLTDQDVEDIRRHVSSDAEIINFSEAADMGLKWYFPLANTLYKSKRIIYHNVIRRYREKKIDRTL